MEAAQPPPTHRPNAPSHNTSAIHAADIFDAGLRANPDNLHLCHAAAIHAHRQGHSDRARALLRRCIQTDPRDGINYQTLARIEEDDGNVPEAHRLYTKAVAVDPRSPSCWNAFGTMEHRHGRLQSAAQKYENALQVDPAHSRSWQCLGIVSSKMAYHNEAIRCFQQALKHNHDRSTAPIYNAWALAEYRRGHVDKARSLFSKGVHQNGRNAPLLHAFAVMERTEGNHEAARHLFEMGHRADPRNSAMLKSWAAMELRLGHIDSSQDWQLDWKPKGPSHKISKRDSAVAEKLLMVNRLLTRRTEHNTRRVLQFLERLAKKDRETYSHLLEETRSDSKELLCWAERRSSKDVKAFEDWFDRRYEEDRRIVSYMFGWKFPPRPPPRPIEWYHLDADANMNSLSEGDRCVTSASSDQPLEYAETLQWLAGFAENLADRSALFLALATVSLLIFSISVGGGLFDVFTVSSDHFEAPLPPRGIDAHLVEGHGWFDRHD